MRWTDGLSTTTANSLRAEGFSSRAELLEAWRADRPRMITIPNVGNGRLEEIRKWLGVEDVIKLPKGRAKP